MSSPQPVEYDERTEVVTNVSYQWACVFLAFALLLDMEWRALVHHEAAWDVMALACLPGFIVLAYQIRHKVLWHRDLVRKLGWLTMLLIGLAFVLGFAASILVTILRMPGK